MIILLRRALSGCALFTLVATLAPATALGADGTQIVGRVLDAGGGLPISGATVSLEHGKAVVATAQTDATGQFVFNNEPPGVYNATVRADGYQQAESSDIFVVAGEAQVTVSLAVSRLSSGLRTIGSVRVAAQTSLQTTATFNQHIDADVIQAQGYVRSGDALGTLPFVNASTSSSIGDDLSLSIRGYNPSETALLLDGHPVGPIGAFGQGYDYQISPFWGLSGMDVVYGSGATGLYGAPTIAGAVNFLTITPTRTPQFTAEQGFGSFGKMLSGLQATGSAGKLGYAVAYGTMGTSGELTGNPTQTNLLSNPSQCGPTITDSLPSIKAADIAACSYTVNGDYLLRNAIAKLAYQLTPSTNVQGTFYDATMWAYSPGNGDTDYVSYPEQTYTHPSAPPTDTEKLPNGTQVSCNNAYVVLNDSPAGYQCMGIDQFNATFYGPSGGGPGRYHDGRQQDYHLRATQQIGPTQFVADGYADAYGFDNIKGASPTANHYTDLYYTHGLLLDDEYAKGRHDLTGGLFIEHQQHLSDNIGAGTVGPDLQLSFSNYFLRDTYTANSKMQFFGDVTVQRDHDTASTFVNPRLSAMFRPTTDDVVRLTAGRSSSMPDPSNLYGGLTFGSPASYNPTCGSTLDSIGSGNNPELQPESATDYEVAYGHRFSQRSVFQADVYTSSELNPLVQGTFPLSTIPQNQIPSDLAQFVAKLQAHCGSGFDATHLGVSDLFNAGSAKYQGYEFDLSVPAGPYLTFDGGYAVQSAAYYGMSDNILVNNTTLINGGQILSVPLQRGNLGVGYSDSNGWSGRLDGYYVGAPNSFNRPGYTYFNFNVAKTIVRGTTLNLGILNLFNSNAQQYGLIGLGLFKPENQFGTDTSALQQGSEQYGLPLRQIWFTVTQKV